MLHELALKLVEQVGAWGYSGIFLLMFLESTFVPFPSEVIMIPAGYLAFKGEMDLYAVIATGIAGSIAGALLNYYLALIMGRKLIVKYGKYVGIKEKTLEKLDRFFQKHGELSTFNGRLIPGIRQLISLPAGLGRMNLLKFTLFTALGAGIWVTVLALLGYFIGQNESQLKSYLQGATLIALAFVLLVTLFYVIRHRRRKKILGEEAP